MLLLNEKNAIDSRAFIVGTTVLTCSELHTQFTVQRDGCSYNYASDRNGNFYSDGGVAEATKKDILARRPITLYISGRDVTGWKEVYKFGRVLWSNVFRHNFSTQMCSVRVRMFDGSEWYGRYSHLNGSACTLRPCKQWSV